MLRIEYIGATWCKVCVTVKPETERLARDFAVKLTMFDVDELDDETITKVPTLRVWEDTVKIAEIVTNHIAALRELLIAKKGVTVTDDF